MVHPVAAEGFSDWARYERARPEYASPAVNWLVASLGLGSDSRIADVGAGTGKLTRALTAHQLSVIAVEPLRSMYLGLVTSNVPIVEAVAEALPLADASLDAITIGQAFHWFDRDRAAAEFRRVLRPRGRVGLIWNVRDRSDEMTSDLSDIMDSVEGEAPWRKRSTPATEGVPGFTDAQRKSFGSASALTRKGVHDMFLSVSHIAALDEGGQAGVAAAIDEVLDRYHGPDADSFAIPYRVDAYCMERLG